LGKAARPGKREIKKLPPPMWKKKKNNNRGIILSINFCFNKYT
jgi:hypothetical protein